MLELERRFLIKRLPNLAGFSSKEIIDIYIPKNHPNPLLRIRKNGEKYEMTKKGFVDPNDNSRLTEETIPLTKEEFDALLKVEGKKNHKIRYTQKRRAGYA